MFADERLTGMSRDELAALARMLAPAGRAALLRTTRWTTPASAWHR
jgi:hypothetical protein